MHVPYALDCFHYLGTSFVVFRYFEGYTCSLGLKELIWLCKVQMW